MNVSASLTRWISASPLTGAGMLMAATAAVATPTLIRGVTDAGQGDGFCPYVPFVVLAAVLLEWRAAAAVAVASAFLAAFLFEGVRFQFLEARCEITGVIYFGLASLLIIVLSQALRRAVAEARWLGAPGETREGMIFSREGGQACVSWPGGRSFVPLGPADEVEAMMRDFLAQQEVGRRLNRGKPAGP